MNGFVIKFFVLNSVCSCLATGILTDTLPPKEGRNSSEIYPYVSIFINLKVRVYINEEPEDDVFEEVEYKDVSSAPSVVVV